EIWLALLDTMVSQRLDEAMLRNLGHMGSLGLLDQKLTSSHVVQEYLHTACRAHPIKVLTAYTQYMKGHSNYRNDAGGWRHSWAVNPALSEALEAAFYRSFQYIKPSGKRILIGLDKSGSMRNSTVAGLEGMTACQAAAVLTMVFLR